MSPLNSAAQRIPDLASQEKLKCWRPTPADRRIPGRNSRLHLVAMDVDAPVFNGTGDSHTRVRVGPSGVGLGGRL